LQAQWSDDARQAAHALLDRIAARALARSAQIVRVRMDHGVEAALPALERSLGAKILSRSAVGNGAGEASILVPEANLTAALAVLRGTGAQGTVSSHKADFVFAAHNPLYARLYAKLSGAPV
jgi:ATP phosphoribosyltransferase